jgi:hypothetical protein
MSPVSDSPPGDDDAQGAARLRRFLRREAGRPALDVALTIFLLYVVVGVVYLFFHVDLWTELQHVFSSQLTFFANVGALLAIVLLWPVLLLTSLVCGVATCGLLF